MSSIKWFNSNYLFQNLKKSKAVLAIFLIIVPILSALVLILPSQGTNNYVTLGFNELSIFAIIGMYIIPVIVSIALFGYIFKRKSSDFINSMPLNRSTIFVTNSIGGIILLTAMILISTLLILIVSYVFPTIIISKGIMIDYFFIWSIVYIFVFTAANLAATVSGNVITQIAVTALILFLCPFLVQSANGFSASKVAEIKCTDSSCVPVTYNCYSDSECKSNQDKGVYTGTVSYNKDNRFSVPYQYISTIYSNYRNLEISQGQLLRMFVLSIVYFGLGVFLFRRRRMEVTETSFKNIHVHNVVKCLTIVPMVIFIDDSIFSRDISLSLLGLTIILAYFFIFDLLTKKHINHIRLSLIYFAMAVTLISCYYYAFSRGGVKPNLTIDANQIKEISIIPSDNLADTSNVYMTDKNLKNLIVKNLISGYQESENSYDLSTNIKLKNGNIYTLNVHNIPERDYEKIMGIAYNDSKFVENFKNINYKNVYAIATHDLVINPNKNKDVVKMITDGLANTNIANYNDLAQGFDITLYTYQNHKTVAYTVNSAISSELTRYISKYTNNLLKKNVDANHISNISISYTPENMYSMTDYLASHATSELYEFIKNNINRTCDVTKDYVSLLVTVENKTYAFYTNNVEGFEKIIENKEKELKNTDEYKEALKIYGDDQSE